jgi:hypothetical protein
MVKQFFRVTKASGVLCALLLGTAPVMGAAVNHIGINPGGSLLDYNTDKPMADAMRSNRISYETSYPKDSNYWETTDGQYLVWAGLTTHNNNGTYRLYFNGKATVSAGGSIPVTNMAYDSLKNLSTATLVISDSNNTDLWLTFSNTRRTPSSATNSGVTNIKLMRPVSKGSAQSYDTSAVFTDYFLAALAPFEAIRFMDWTATNSCGDSLWSDRTLWTHASQNPPNLPGRTYGWQGRGGSWESVIMLCNQTGKDAWINIPAKATDDYITQLATLFKNGNAYTPGLKPELHLYIEYSNEIWNTAGAFTQTAWCQSQAVAYGAPLNYDGMTDAFTLCFRYKAMRTVRISEIFRSVFGDAAMMTHIRPVLEWQQGYNDLTSRTLDFIDKWYTKRDSRSTASAAHPVNYYVYGGSGSAYWSGQPVSGTPTIDNVWTMGDLDASVWESKEINDANWAACFGLHQTAYEGGGVESIVSASFTAQVNGDPRMKDNYLAHQKAWNHIGADLLMYFNLSSGATPGLSVLQEIDNLTTPKYQAIVAMQSTAPDTLTHGNVAPFTCPGGSYDIWSYNSPSTKGGAVSLQANGEMPGYTFRVTGAGTYGIQVEYTNAAAAGLAIDFAGVPSGSFSLTATSTGTRTPAINVVCQPDHLYGIRVICTQGTASVQNVMVNLVSTATVERKTGTVVAARGMRVAAGKAGILVIDGLQGNEQADIVMVNSRGMAVRPPVVAHGGGSCLVTTRGFAKGVYLLRIRQGKDARICKVTVGP